MKNQKTTKEIIEILKSGGVCIAPTETVYGIMCTSLNPESIERLYKLKNRPSNQQTGILIGSVEDLSNFSLSLTNERLELLKRVWEKPISIVIRHHGDKFEYLHRGNYETSFRLIKEEPMASILKEVGPISASSTNPAGFPFATTIEKSYEYFGESVDGYLDGGEKQAIPSTIIEILDDDTCKIIREGDVSKEELSQLIQIQDQ